MLNFPGRTWMIRMLAASLLCSPSACRKPAEAEKAELKKAGYALTREDWMEAASHDDVLALGKFLAAGLDISTTDGDGNTALHAAAAAGARKSAALLLDRGLAIDSIGAGGRTPLMAAVIAGQAEMTAWLLRQGADPKIKDDGDYNALMLAVRENSTGALAEITPYHRENLDSALLLAALTGRTAAIDTLTSYGASVYARMDDGRTPLMLAAENGHTDAVELLLEIGSSRFSTDQNGHSAADLATEARHGEIAAMILRPPQPDDFVFESPEQIAMAMDEFVEESRTAAVADTVAGASATSATSSRPPALPIDGLVLGPAASPDGSPGTGGASPGTHATPPIVMRHFRQRELPIEVRTVSDEAATLAILGTESREITVRPGDPIPGSNLVVLRVRQRVLDSKLTLGRPEEVSVVDVRDTTTGADRQWITGLPASAHDPVALVEDAVTGRRYTATAGQRFRSGDGVEFIVADVRPTQIVIENTTTGETRTISLSGPRG